MSEERKKLSTEFKAKVALDVLSGESSLAAWHPNTVHDEEKFTTPQQL